MKRTLFNITLLFIALFIVTAADADNYHRELPLMGPWKFKLGDNALWAASAFDDSGWSTINAPDGWEKQGYQGYDGFAWYRKTVEIPSSFLNRTLILELGCIDDVDEVFFNGIKIGQSGSFPPNYTSAYNAFRKYEVPLNVVKYDKPNIVSIRVYDAQLEGGIVRGKVFIGVSDIALIPEINLNGAWNFNTGKERNELRLREIIVPGQWENQGFFNYDGYAVYSRTFILPAGFSGKRMVFLAGRIDDYDQLFINGKMMGETGDFSARTSPEKSTLFRHYFIPEGVLKTGENKVMIKVYDRGGEGGILEGPVGLITQESFIKYWRMKRIK
jgi:sialate O-acetylesterase